MLRHSIAVVVCGCIGSQIAQAQWKVVRLNPIDGLSSSANGVSFGQQAGWAEIGGRSHACKWSGSAASWIDLHPTDAVSSHAENIDQCQQVGQVTIGTTHRASLWKGTADSWVDLHPVGATRSIAYGSYLGRQVGSAAINGLTHASLWSGAATSWVDLNPTGAAQSYASGIFENSQVGIAIFGVTPHASLWTGTADSWVDLNPVGASESQADSVHAGQQSGHARIGGVWRASLWRGTPESWVDLHPEGSSESTAYGLYAGQQVGIAVFDGVGRASLWSSTAQSWEDLSIALSGSWGDTEAHSIWSDESTTMVVGIGLNNTTGRREALLWTRSCTPIVVAQTNTVSICPTGSAQFIVAPAAAAPITYNWEVEIEPNFFDRLVNGPNHTPIGLLDVQGSDTSIIQVHIVSKTHQNSIALRCLIKNACGDVFSTPSRLVLCYSDFNCDGNVTSSDFYDFIDSFFRGSADFNNDGSTTSEDFFDFIEAFLMGC